VPLHGHRLEAVEGRGVPAFSHALSRSCSDISDMVGCNAGPIVPGGVKFVVPGETMGAWRCAEAGLVTESLGPGLGVIFLLHGRSSLWRRLTVLCLADPWVACPE
jgi:hypothetical protein